MVLLASYEYTILVYIDSRKIVEYMRDFFLSFTLRNIKQGVPRFQNGEYLDRSQDTPNVCLGPRPTPFRMPSRQILPELQMLERCLLQKTQRD